MALTVTLQQKVFTQGKLIEQLRTCNEICKKGKNTESIFKKKQTYTHRKHDALKPIHCYATAEETQGR